MNKINKRDRKIAHRYRFKLEHEIDAFLTMQDKMWKNRHAIITKDDIAAFLFIPRDREKMTATIDSIYRVLCQLSDEEDEMALLALAIVTRTFYKRVRSSDEPHDLVSLGDNLAKIREAIRLRSTINRPLLTSSNPITRLIARIMLSIQKALLRIAW